MRSLRSALALTVAGRTRARGWRRRCERRLEQQEPGADPGHQGRQLLRHDGLRREGRGQEARLQHLGPGPDRLLGAGADPDRALGDGHQAGRGDDRPDRRARADRADAGDEVRGHQGDPGRHARLQQRRSRRASISSNNQLGGKLAADALAKLLARQGLGRRDERAGRASPRPRPGSPASSRRSRSTRTSRC